MRLAILYCALGLLLCGCNKGRSRQVMTEQQALEIVQACSGLASDARATGKEFFDDLKSLPKPIQSLKPQIVHVVELQGNVYVDIQLRGGFQHYGYLVVVPPSDPGFRPTTGRNWDIREVTENVYEYEE